MIHHDKPITEKDTLRFRREIKILSTLNHPGIIPIHDADVEGASIYAVMSHAPGESVRARLEREGRLPVDDAVRIAVEVAEALDYAHRRGIIHRAIRPECIILSGGRALITDFGVARPMSASASEVTTVGSPPQGPPEYLSPEQMLAGFEADGRADIYTLGVVVFEMLTGTIPFRRADGGLDRTAKYSGPPVAPSALRKEVPAWLDAVVNRALAPYPENRFGSAIELAMALRNHGQ
jgi:serine/threonine-protein kinase